MAAKDSPDDASIPLMDVQQEETKEVKGNDEVKQSTEDTAVKSGPEWSKDGAQEFSVRVHVIEARELKGREDSGRSDPICYVKVHNQTQKTPVFKKTLNVVFDHCFFFTLTMNKAEFENCTVVFEVYDANAIRRDVLIGASAVDLNSVFKASDTHEMYKQWLALTDTNGDFDGVQGYLQFSCAVAPEGEALPPPHAEEDDDDIDLENVDLADLVMNAPDIHLQEYYLNISIYEMQDLPKVDSLGGAADPYIRVKLGSRSAKVQEKRNTLNPRFCEELRLPAALPSMSDRIEILVMDWDRGNADDLICSKYFSFNEILKKPLQPQWVHFYGAPNADCGDVGEPYNRGYKEGTVYRGRMYIGLDAKPAVKPKIGKRNLPKPTYPKDEPYKLTIDLYEGSEIIQTSNKVTLDFSFGAYHLDKVTSTKSKRGSVHFYTQMDDKIMLPGDVDMRLPDAAPDLLIDCYVKQMFGTKRCGYMRLKVTDILGWNNEARWYEFKPDEYGFKYSESQMPGAVLMKIGFGKWNEAPDIRPHLAHLQRAKFQLRAHIYQARQLPAADDNGLSDPYVTVSIAGEVMKSTKKKATVNPSFYETLVADVELPAPLEYAPPVSIMVYDWDQMSGDDMLGRFTVPIALIDERMPVRPQWYELYFDDPGETEGSLLAAFQLIPADKADSVPVKPIKPKSRDCYFEINVVGLRNMVPWNMLAINNPKITFDTGDSETRNETQNEARGDGVNLDLLETVHLSVALPIDDLYAPYVNMMVYDQRLLGDTLVGSASIPVAPYLPWNIKKREDEKKAALEAKIAASSVMPIAASRTNDPDITEPLIDDGGGDERTLPEVAAQEIVVDMDDDDDDDDDDVYEESSSEDEKEKQKKDEWPQVTGELEADLADELPFQEFELWRGKARGLNKLEQLAAKKEGGTKKLGGLFKGRFRVIENSKLRYVDDPINLKTVYKPKKMVARVYVYKGTEIVPHDDNGYSDPYLILICGDHKTKKADGGLVMKTQAPEFWKCYDIPTTIPGPRLRIQCWDHDALSGDDLIGATEIDLENRYFCPKWKEWEKKPIEFRTLWSDASKSPQGRLQVCVEIMSVKKAARHPPRNIAPPPPKPMELRVIVWETRNVNLKEESKVDIFVTGMLEGMKPNERQETDTHWNSKDGTGSFNWRMKFPIELPYPTPRLKVGIWDKDLVSANDVLAEAILDLKMYFKRAFKSGKGFEFVDKWVACYHPNYPNQVQGEVKLTVELIDKATADSHPNGYGIDDPNQYPTLPERDRPDNSFNPLNPLGWMKLGGGALFGGLKKLCVIAVLVGIAMLIWQFS